MNSIKILDPGLVHDKGHHADLDLKIVRSLTSLGKVVEVFASRSIDARVRQVFEAHCRVTPVFRAFPYLRPEELDPVAGGHFAFERHARTLAEDMSAIPGDSVWIFPSLFATQLFATALARNATHVSGCLHVPADDMYAQSRVNWRTALVACRSKGVSLHLGVLEPELRPEYQALANLDFDIRQFPIPYDSPFSDRSARAACHVLGFFGLQRDEKGLGRVMELTEGLLARGFKVVFHDSLGRGGPRPHPSLSVLGHVPSLGEAIARCDAVILPYSVEHYRSKGSGILWECLAAGVPVVAPLGSTMGRWLNRFDCGVCYAEGEASAVYKAVELLARNYEFYARNAELASRWWATAHGIDRFVGSLLPTDPGGVVR